MKYVNLLLLMLQILKQAYQNRVQLTILALALNSKQLPTYDCMFSQSLNFNENHCKLTFRGKPESSNVATVLSHPCYAVLASWMWEKCSNMSHTPEWVWARLFGQLFSKFHWHFLLVLSCSSSIDLSWLGEFTLTLIFHIPQFSRLWKVEWKEKNFTLKIEKIRWCCSVHTTLCC